MNQMIDIYKKKFEYYKSLADDSIAQLDDDSLFVSSHEDSNSIAIIMKHMAGNMLSRWTNIFTEDGEKPWRNRDREFIDTFENVNDLKAYWEKGWNCLFTTLNSLVEADLEKIIYIRNMGHSINEAFVRQLCHYSYHVGQIVFASKQLKGEGFKSLSIPKNSSSDYNKSKFAKDKRREHFTDDL